MIVIQSKLSCSTVKAIWVKTFSELQSAVAKCQDPNRQPTIERNSTTMYPDLNRINWSVIRITAYYLALVMLSVALAL